MPMMWQGTIATVLNSLPGVTAGNATAAQISAAANPDFRCHCANDANAAICQAPAACVAGLPG